jgi:hypothetical protein
MRALSIVHESTGRRLVREFYPMRFLWFKTSCLMNRANFIVLRAELGTFFKISGPLILADFPLCKISGPKL